MATDFWRISPRAVPFEPEEGRGNALCLNTAILSSQGVFGSDHLDPRARPFFLLRTQIMAPFHQEGGRVLVITSPQPANGKTFVAANLAMALSRMTPTTLIDLDLHQPALGQRLSLPPMPGIDDFLAGGTGLDSVLRPVAGMDLMLGAVRRARPDAGELLASDRLDLLFSTLRNAPEDRLCIVDAPPVVALEDVLRISAHADGVLMVVEEGRTRRDELLEAVRLIDPAPVIGTVLNKSITGARQRSADKYYYSHPRPS